MSEDESFSTSRGQYNSADITLEEHEANDSIIQKVKSTVSSILPQTLSKWFSSSNVSEDNRNGNIRRRRCEDDSFHDSDPENSQYEHCSLVMPPMKKTRLNSDEFGQPAMTKHAIDKIGDNKFISSTPLDIRGRKELHSGNYLTTDFISPTAKSVKPLDDIEEETDIIEVIPKLSNKTNQAKRNMNVSSVSSRIPENQFARSGTGLVNFSNSFLSSNLVKKRKIQSNSPEDDDGEEECENEEIDYCEDDLDGDDEDEENSHAVRKARIMEKSSILSNGISNMPNIIISQNENQDSASESGESQCSSVINQQIVGQNRRGLFSFNRTRNLEFGQLKQNSANGFNFYSHLEGKKSLFSSKNMHSVLNNSTMSLTSLNRRQQFNPSLYGSTSALSDSRLLNTTSPFYKGRTTYGGASAYGNSFLSSSARQIRIKPTLIRPSSSLSNVSNSSQEINMASTGNFDKNAVRISATGNSTAISSTAKRILELMDQFTTPLNEARKMAESLKNSQNIGNKTRFTEADYHANKALNTAIRLQKPKTPYSRSQETNRKHNLNENMLPPVNDLQVPSMAQLLQLKTLQANTERNREVATSNEKSILNKKTDYNILKNERSNTSNVLSSHSGKIKTKITSTRPSKNLHDLEILESVTLPDIPLPLMKSIPKFDITPPSTNSAYKFPLNSISTSKPTLGNTSTAINSSIKSSSTIADYKFSNPIMIDCKIDLKSQSPQDNFKFSSPTTVDSYKNSNEKVKNDAELIEGKQSEQFSQNLPQFNRRNIKENPIAAPVTNSVNNTTPKLKSGSVLDVLNKSSATADSKVLDNTLKPLRATENKNNNLGFGDAFKKPANMWECSICLIRNNENCEKCAACGASKKDGNEKKNTAFPAPSPMKMNSSLNEQFKVNPNTWECSTCMIRNKNEAPMCVACNTAKPKIVSDSKKFDDNNDVKKVGKTVESTKTTGSTFKEIVAQQNSKWECSACMTRNDTNRSKCICCEQAKPESSNSSGKIESSKTVDSTFKQIIDQQNAKWECSACMTRNDSNRSKCICCEQAKPGSSTSGVTGFSLGTAASKFTFGFNKSSEDSLKKTEEKLDSQDTTTSQGKSGFGFGISSNPVFVAPKSVTTPSTFSFGINKTTSTSGNNSITSAVKLIDNNKPNPSVVNISTLETKTSKTLNKPTENVSFMFGSPKTTDETDLKTKAFSFGSPTSNTTNIVKTDTKVIVTSSEPTNPAAGFSFGSPQIQAASLSKTTTAGFSYGSPSMSTSTLSISSTSSPKTQAIVPTTANFIFGSIKTTTSVTTTATPVSTTWSTVFGSPLSINNQVASGFGNLNNEQSPKTAIGAGSQISSSNVLQFGANGNNNKSINNDKNFKTSAPVFGSPSTMNSGNNKFGFASPSGSTIFGSNTNTATTTPFGFGSPKTVNDSVGNTAINIGVSSVSNPNNSMFGTPNNNINNSNNNNFNNKNDNCNNSNSNNNIINNIDNNSNNNFNNGNTSNNINNTSTININKINNDNNTGNIINNNKNIIGNNNNNGSNIIKNNNNSDNNINSNSNIVNNNNNSNNNNSNNNNNNSNNNNNNSLMSSTNSNPNNNNIFNNDNITSNISSNNNNNTFGSSTAFGSSAFGSQSSTSSIFGQSASVPNLFGNSIVQQQPQQQQQKPSSSFSSTGTNLFGSNTSGSTLPFTFGNTASPTPSFGCQTTPMPTFRNPTTNNNTSFTLPTQEPAKKLTDTPFNFNAAVQNPPSGGFSFNSNNNTNINKPAFNFSAQTMPSFNFTGSEAINSSQPFQFGASSITTTIPPVFNFGSNETPSNAPFTFNASTASTNLFAPTPTPGTSTTARRKIRPGTRRTQTQPR